MILGYARVSTREQHLEQQLDALEKYGCDRIYQDQVSGQKDKRPGLDAVLNKLRSGDTLVCWRLDRIGRDFVHLERLITKLDADGIKLVSIKENLDTKSATGKLMYRIMAVIAEFELDVIRERTEAGMQRAKREGKKIGRDYSAPRVLMQRVIDLKLDGLTPAQIRKQIGNAPSDQTIYRWAKLYKRRDPSLMEYLKKGEQ